MELDAMILWTVLAAIAATSVIMFVAEEIRTRRARTYMSRVRRIRHNRAVTLDTLRDRALCDRRIGF